MYENLTMFKMSHAMARHAGQRQALVAQNMANSDTPGFKPRDLTPFAETVRSSAGMVATRGSHLHGAHANNARIIQSENATPSPNGNAVTLEEEMLRAVAVKRQHDRALAIYRHSMTMLRASIGNR